VDGKASFCHNCGTKQPDSASSEFTEVFGGITDRTASVLCYIPVFGIIPSIIFLASQKYRTNARVRFDAFQTLYLFVAWLIVSTALPGLFWGVFHTGFMDHVLLGVVKSAVFICWIYLLIKAAQREQVRIPIIGDLAARSAAEQM
jgi:uncharacterized membrane protein